jgi:hypothetical protein
VVKRSLVVTHMDTSLITYGDLSRYAQYPYSRRQHSN